MKKQNQAIQNQYTRILNTAVEIKNETNADKRYVLIPTQATQIVSLWLAIAADGKGIKDLSPNLEAAIKHNPKRFENLYPKDECLIRRVWAIDEVLKCRQCGLTH